jgi:hypothetical protein
MRVSFTAPNVPDFVFEHTDHAIFANQYNTFMASMVREHLPARLEKTSERNVDGVIVMHFNNGITVLLNPENDKAVH